MRLLTKSEEKHFSKEWEVLTIESGEDTEEEDNVQAEEPPRRTIQGPDQVDVVTTKDQSDRKPTKRRKVVEDSGAGRRPESRMVDAQVTHLRMPKRRARPKKKANRKIVVSESLESSVAMSETAASTKDEDMCEESNLRMGEAGPSGVQNEAPMEKEVEPSEKSMATVSPSLSSSESSQHRRGKKYPSRRQVKSWRRSSH